MPPGCLRDAAHLQLHAEEVAAQLDRGVLAVAALRLLSGHGAYLLVGGGPFRESSGCKAAQSAWEDREYFSSNSFQNMNTCTLY